MAGALAARRKMKWDPHLGGEANHHLPRRLAAGVFAETSQPMSEPFGGSSFRILGDITQ
jgi:hypothetical protein